MKPIHLSRISAWLLLLLMSYAAVSKLLILPEFRGQMLNQNLPRAVAEAAVWLIPATEGLTCVLLWQPRRRRYGFALAAGLLAVFTLYIALVMLGVWARVPCSCGGVIGQLSWMAHFWFNMVFLAVALTGLQTTPGR